MKRKRLSWVVMALVVVFCAAARSPAGPTTDSWIARFEAPQQSIWSQGGVVFAPEASGYLPYTAGIFEANVGYDLKIDLGSLTGNVEGQISASYPSYLPNPGPVNVDMSYAPLADESQIHTTLGATAKMTAHIGLDMPWPVPDISQDWTLAPDPVGFDWKDDFTANLGSTATISGESQVLASLGVDVVLAGLNFDLALYQDVSFAPERVTGYLGYTHMETLSEEAVFFSVAGDDTPISVPLDLDRPGHWEVTVGSLGLENTFSHKIGAQLTGSLWAVGIGNILSMGPRYGFWDNDPFPLDFSEVETLGRFNIYVDEGSATSAVPVPGAVWLLGSGLFVLAAGQRRYNRWK